MDTNPIEARNETDNVPLQLDITAFVHYEPSWSLKLEFQSGHEDKGYNLIVMIAEELAFLSGKEELAGSIPKGG